MAEPGRSQEVEAAAEREASANRRLRHVVEACKPRNRCARFESWRRTESRGVPRRAARHNRRGSRSSKCSGPCAPVERLRRSAHGRLRHPHRPGHRDSVARARSALRALGRPGRAERQQGRLEGRAALRSAALDVASRAGAPARAGPPGESSHAPRRAGALVRHPSRSAAQSRDRPTLQHLLAEAVRPRRRRKTRPSGAGNGA